MPRPAPLACLQVLLVVCCVLHSMQSGLTALALVTTMPANPRSHNDAVAAPTTTKHATIVSNAVVDAAHASDAGAGAKSVGKLASKPAPAYRRDRTGDDNNDKDDKDAAARDDTVMTRNRIHITDSQIVLAASDKKALLKAIANAVVVRSAKLGAALTGVSNGGSGSSDDTGANDPAGADARPAANDDIGSSGDAGTTTASTRTTPNSGSATPATPATRIIAAVLFPVSRDAFLYYAPDPRDATKSVIRLGWRYSLADWKLYRALIPPTACEVKRAIGSYYYC